MSILPTDTFWHVYPLGFVGAPIREQSDDHVPSFFNHMANWLDYAVDLGVSGIQFGPIFASMTHGYDTLDHFSIDPRLGSEEAFRAFVDACHGRGLKVMLDGVLNHLGLEHQIVQAAIAEGFRGDHADWIAHGWEGDQPRPRVFEGHESLVELNHDSDRVRGYAVDVLCHWLERGIDGWRLDAAYAIPASFWADVLPRVRKWYPDAYFVGEMIHGDYAGYVQASTLTAVTQYELWKSMWSSLKDENFFELQWTLNRHNDLLGTFVPQTFNGNHDVTRIASQVGPEKAALAAAILLTVGGSPSLYYGDEQGFQAIKEARPGGDDAVRPSFPGSPCDLSPDGWWLYRLYQRLLAMRRNRPWLAAARVETLELTTTHYRYRAGDPGGSEAIEVDLWLEDGPGFTIRDGMGQEILSWSCAAVRI